MSDNVMIKCSYCGQYHKDERGIFLGDVVVVLHKSPVALEEISSNSLGTVVDVLAGDRFLVRFEGGFTNKYHDSELCRVERLIAALKEVSDKYQGLLDRYVKGPLKGVSCCLCVCVVNEAPRFLGEEITWHCCKHPMDVSDWSMFPDVHKEE